MEITVKRWNGHLKKKKDLAEMAVVSMLIK